ncbi:coatomer protein [Lactarius akahatsu]|uniref:Coatomer subunit zeta n=1 Tax=Lactarius akahatsu TaxID=416441 RepID=A0AAD4QFC3_9AGAM|nr:coatomer protein [Lactarius akahatsu]
MNLTLYAVNAFIVLDTDGHRVLAKYYSPKGRMQLGDPDPNKGLQTLKEQRAFEKGLFAKTKKPGGDITLYDGHLAVYRHSLDLIFYVLGGPQENELMLYSALSAFMEAINLLLRNQVEKRAVLENLDCVILCLDETIDDGIIVETDSTTIGSRVSRPRADSTDIVINEQTILNAYQTVKEKMQQRIGQL